MEKQNLNSFYYDLLNIKKRTNDYEVIKQIIRENKSELFKVISSFDGFCKVISNNISLDLFNKNISNSIINTKEILGCYEHEFIVAYYKDNDILKYVLIDPSYEQFIKKEGENLLSSFKEWPATVLSSSEQGKGICDTLISEGCCHVNEEEIKLYLNSFINIKDLNNIEFNLEDIIIDKIGKRI